MAERGTVTHWVRTQIKCTEAWPCDAPLKKEPQKTRHPAWLNVLRLAHPPSPVYGTDKCEERAAVSEGRPYEGREDWPFGQDTGRRHIRNAYLREKWGGDSMEVL